MIAPKIARKKLLMLKPSVVPHPNIVPIQPPTKAPRIPIIIDAIQPPGSAPGRIALAIAPAIRPNKIHDKIPIVFCF